MTCDPTGRTWWTRARNRIKTPSHRPESDSNESEGRSGGGCHLTVECWSNEANELTNAFLRHIQRKFTVVILEWVLSEPTIIRISTSPSGIRGSLRRHRSFFSAPRVVMNLE